MKKVKRKCKELDQKKEEKWQNGDKTKIENMSA